MLSANQWLDVAGMRSAAQCLLGEQDFSSFRSSECQSKTPIKTLYDIQIWDQKPWIYIVVRANAFLHHMVRNLVGSLLAIGQGKQPASWLAEVLEAKSRQRAAPTFSPDGLYLARVGYPPEHQIPAPWLAHSWLPAELITLLQEPIPAKPKQIMI
jgi:tRNA pseudouridine38-40 synthase